MNIKLEIEGKKYEIDCAYLDLWDGDEYENDSNYEYRIYDTDGEDPVLIGEEDGYYDFAEAAGAGFHHLMGILTNDDHSIEEDEDEEYCNCEGACGNHSNDICRDCNKCPDCCTCKTVA
jgi:hypothetical protein